ncbi:MAG: AEC family transporter [Clostridia bacterium]
MVWINVLVNVALLLGMGAIGLILRKSKLVKAEAIEPLLVILLYVCQPFMVANSLLKQKFDKAFLVNIGLSFIFCCVITMILFGIGRILVLKGNVEKNKVYRFGAVFGNCGFFGLPLLSMLYGDDSPLMLYATVFIIVFNLFSWSLGVYIITGDKKYASLKKAIINPAMVGVIFAVPLYLLKITLPLPILNVIGLLGSMTTPLSMIILGLRMGQIPIKNIFIVPKIYFTAIIKMIIAPLIMILILKTICLFFPLDNGLMTAMVLMAGMPVAVNTVAYTERFGTITQAEEATKLLLCSTIIAIFTIPLVSALISAIL